MRKIQWLQKGSKILAINFYPGFPCGVIMQSIISEFQSRGIQVVKIDIDHREYRKNPDIQAKFHSFLATALQKQKMDGLFCIQRDLRQVLASCHEEIPLLTFVTDPMLAIDSLTGDNDFIISWSATQAAYLKKRGYQNVIHIPMMADSFLRGNAIPQLQSDIIFFGNYWPRSPQEQKHELDGMENIQPGIREYIQHLIDLVVRRAFTGNLYELLDNYLPKSLDLQIPPSKIWFYIFIEATGKIRLQVLEKLASFDLKVIGYGWDHAPASESLRRCFLPCLAIHEQSHVFASAKINLNIASPGHWSAPTNRFFNIPGSECLELCDWSEGLDAYLQPETEMLYYRAEDDLSGSISSILSNYDDFQEVIAAGNAKVCQYYTYREWVTELFRQWSP
jgi:hypothetical protein